MMVMSSTPLPKMAVAMAVATALSSCKRDAPEPPRLRVAAASDLTLAFGEARVAFERKTGIPVDVTFGATGMLARQIEEGAPFDVFAAANVSFVDEVVRRGACFGDTRSVYARGRIVLWASDAALVPRDLRDLADPKYRKVAIANPEHAPYGRAARDALIEAGLWSKLAGRIVQGENVQQALAFAQSGNADVAIVAESLVAAHPELTRTIDTALYPPIDQALVACKGARGAPRIDDARAFIRFVREGEGRAIMRRHGFALPEGLRDD